MSCPQALAITFCIGVYRLSSVSFPVLYRIALAISQKHRIVSYRPRHFPEKPYRIVSPPSLILFTVSYRIGDCLPNILSYRIGNSENLTFSIFQALCSRCRARRGLLVAGNLTLLFWGSWVRLGPLLGSLGACISQILKFPAPKRPLRARHLEKRA